MTFAAIMLVTLGLMQALQGLAAVLKGEFFAIGPNYAYKIDVSGWGWIHLCIGLLVAVVGSFLFTGAEWARGVAMGLAVLSILAQFMFMPYYPWWALLIIVLDVFVIWSLVVAPRRGDRAPYDYE